MIMKERVKTHTCMAVPIFEPEHGILVHIAYTRSHSLRMHTQLSSGETGIMVALRLYLQ